MKILHLASEYPPGDVHGLGRFVHGLARAQAALGHDVHVLTNSHGGQQDDVTADGVRLHRITFPNPPQPADGHGEVLQWNHGAVSRFLDRREALRDVDVVVCHDWLAAIAAREVAQLLGRPLIATIHDEVVGKRWGILDGPAELVRDLEALLVRDANLVLANSAYIARQVVRHYGVSAARVEVAPGGVDPAVVEVSAPALIPAFRSALAEPGEPVVLFVGRLDPEKGLETLARAIPTVHAGRSGVRFVIAGQGKLEPWLRQQLGNAATFVGYVKGETLAHLYRAADVVVVPSTYEPLGLVPLEGMLAGAAVVVSGAGGLTEVVRDGVDGRVVPPGDAEALARTLLDLLHAPEARCALAARGQLRARSTFAWSAIAGLTTERYERALGQAFQPSERAPERPEPPLVSVTVDATSRDPRAALTSLVRRTHYRPLELVLAGDAVALAGLQGELSAQGLAVRVGGPEVARGELLCALDPGAEVPPGSEGWLDGLVWLLEERDAASVAPTIVTRRSAQTTSAFAAPRPDDGPGDPACVLTRRRGGGDGRWVHPVQVFDHSTSDADLPVSIVLVAYQGLRFTRAAIDALLANTPPPYELVLVCNGARDGTREYFRSLRDALGGSVAVQLLENEENLGYPKAANQGLRAAQGRDVVLLNNDAEVRPGWLPALLAARGAERSVGAVTAKILNHDGTVQSAGGVEHAPDGTFSIPLAGEDRLAPPVAERRFVDNAGGPCLLLTRELIDAVGVFDEAFSPGYFEDSDLCLRAREAGFSLLYEPKAEVFHHAKATSSLVAREGKLDIWRRFEENKALFHERWADRLQRDAAARRAPPERKRRILLCYHRDERTTAATCETTLRLLGHDVVVAGRGQTLEPDETMPVSELVGRAATHLDGEIDLLLVIEGATFVPADVAEAPCPTALWAIDNHLHADPQGPTGSVGHYVLAREFDHVFLAQRDYVPAFHAQGIRTAWLPVACDPHGETPPDGPRPIDVAVVVREPPFHHAGLRLAERLARRCSVVRTTPADAVSTFARARVVVDAPVHGELGADVFEAIAAGALVVTQRRGNGLEALLADGEHLALHGQDDLESVVARYLGDEALRQRVAGRGQRLVTSHHTYRQRMHALVRAATAVPPRRLSHQPMESRP